MRDSHQHQIVLEAAQLLGDEVADHLWARGWSLAAPGGDRDAALQWLWLPTSGAEDDESPWTTPTRITQRKHHWLVEFGSTLTHAPRRAEVRTDVPGLLADLSRIEIWPMPDTEARRLRGRRILELTTLKARQQLSRSFRWTEPYLGRLARIQALQRRQHQRTRRTAFDPIAMPMEQAYLAAQETTIEAEAWVSALRTARAGGAGWDINGQEQTP